MKKENILLLSSVAICITLLLGIYDSWKVDIVLGLGIINLVAAFLIRQERHTETTIGLSQKGAASTSISTPTPTVSPYTAVPPSFPPHTFSHTHSTVDVSAHTPVHGDTHTTPSPLSFSPSPLDDKHTPVRKPRRKKVTVEHTL